MNYKELVNDLEKKTGKTYKVCSDIIVAYEKYCEDQVKLPFKKEVDIEMVNWVSTVTGYDEKTIQVVLISFISIVRNELKYKIPFVK